MKKTVFTYDKKFKDGFNFKVTAVNGHSVQYRILVTYQDHIVSHSSGSGTQIVDKNVAEKIIESERNEFLKFEKDKDFLNLLA